MGKDGACITMTIIIMIVSKERHESPSHLDELHIVNTMTLLIQWMDLTPFLNILDYISLESCSWEGNCTNK